MKTISKLLIFSLLFGILFSFPTNASEKQEITEILLSSEKNGDTFKHTATTNGKNITEYDYVWHADPSKDHGVVKNSPAEYYTGTAPKENEEIYIAHDIYYYPLLEQNKFKQANYDGETEWIYHYEAKGYENYIFSTLPALKTGFPSHMMHSEEDAYNNAVLHIKKAGVYSIKGNWHGQIRIDLGEDSFDNPNKKVTLILNGADIECTVASAIIFAEVYECDNTWEDKEEYSHIVDTKNAGANIIIADGTENNLSGTNIFRILKTQYKDEDSTDTYPAQKKRLKVDGALYSYRSLNIEGQEKNTGILNITSGFEGLNTELHLTFNGGNINIYSQDDGINVNEDGVSVLTVNNANLHICAGLGAEGDGIDSNGFLVINGGTVISCANPAADSGMDSDCGSYVYGGTVVALGATMDWAKADSNTKQATLNMQFSSSQNSDEAIIITDKKDKIVFAYDPDKDEVMGENTRTFSGAIISSPTLKIGSTYRIYVGGDIEGNEISGVYNVDSIKKFKNASRQCYSGNSLGGFGGMRPQGDFGNPPAKPEGEMPDGNFEGHKKPNGEQGAPPEMPENQNGIPPENFNQGENRQGFQAGQNTFATCNFENEFTLNEAVNNFSSVSDFNHSLKETNGKYVCENCGETFKDAEGKEAVFKLSQWVIYLLLILAGVAISAAIFITINLIKKKKH